MSEKRILIASLLKPITDTRLYEKLALSVSGLPDTQVHVCGYEAPLPDGAPGNIHFHPLFTFRRLSAARFKAQFTFYLLLKKLEPDVVIICTHELLLPCYFYSRNNRVKLIYDVQENYALNLRKQHNYNFLLKRLLARGVRALENFVAPHISHFILAEQSYEKELPFIRNRYTIIENKYRPGANYTTPTTSVQLGSTPLRLLYSGTIAKEYGIFEAIELADKLYQADNSTTLTIIGYCANDHTLRQVKQRLKNRPYIHLIGGDKLVPHRQIVEQIGKSNVGLLPYQPNESTFRCIPTKLYEYMAHALPVVVQQNSLWHSIVLEYQAGLSVDFKTMDELELIHKLRCSVFYTSGISKNIFWITEEKKLLQLFTCQEEESINL